jgi:hypothetical protein
LVNPLGKIGHILAITKPFNAAPLSLPPTASTETHRMAKQQQPKRASLVWEMMFSRGLFGVEIEKQGAILNRVSALVDAKVLR